MILRKIDTTKTVIGDIIQIEKHGDAIMTEIGVMIGNKNIDTKARIREDHVNKVMSQGKIIGTDKFQEKIHEKIEIDPFQGKGHIRGMTVTTETETKTVIKDKIVEIDELGQEHRKGIGTKTGKEK